MQVNVKEFTCIPCVNHLEHVLMNVLVLQSFLAVSFEHTKLSSVCLSTASTVSNLI